MTPNLGPYPACKESELSWVESRLPQSAASRARITMDTRFQMMKPIAVALDTSRGRPTLGGTSQESRAALGKQMPPKHATQEFVPHGSRHKKMKNARNSGVFC